MDRIVMQRLQVAMPRYLVGHVLDTLKKRPRANVPSPSLVNRSEIAVDASLLLVVQNRPDTLTAGRFCHSDSPPPNGTRGFGLSTCRRSDANSSEHTVT